MGVESNAASMEGLKSSMKEVEARLSDHLVRRERVLKESRDVISSCSRAIIDVHNGRLAEAERGVATARSMLASLRKASAGPVSRYLVSPEAEFVEASAVLAIARGRRLPSARSLGTSAEAYLLGLLDTVGELKRMVLDSVMKGRLKDAREYFYDMESLYSTCSPLAVYDHVANGTRRKIDVARMLVEDTRGLLAEEAGREKLSSSMERVYKMLKVG